MGDPQLLDDYIRMYFETFKNIDDLINAPMKADGLSFEQFFIMHDLAAGHQLAMTEIAQRRGVTRAAISRQIKALMARGMITQERHVADRRRLPLALTASGAAVVERLDVTIALRFERWVTILGEADARELLRLLQKVGDKLMRSTSTS
ncbi:MarR family winged helix-turn-helix transcriptional regulator [Lacticaseibacillus parakribbianus]|uniref:MarR family winged helix-turn-helix transcriptional regulator n=1 Tax=Lacticaseibacillus parakribbianus TaxID=2970927 RepID=UPI0021CB8822|nr:MarR family transcriptional regulator [Lacticaseibacillus parakribbianus]